MLRILISTGEVSGDLQGSLLVEALFREASRRKLDLEVFALGGPRIKNAGATLISNTAPMGAIGLWEALPYVIPTFRVQSRLDNSLKINPPDALVLIDYMGPNIRLGNKMRRLNPKIPIIYYIAPQEWAWRLGDGGTTDLIGFTDKILAIFKAEADFYQARGGQVSWVGHPMLDMLKERPKKKNALEKLGLHSSQKLLLLFPASRKQELKYLMPSLAKAAAILQKHDPSIYVMVPSSLANFDQPLQEILDKNRVIGRVLPANQVDELKPTLFSAAELALCKSGTINMELALNNVPQVVGYRVSRVTAFIARNILKFQVDHISPVNLLLKQRLVPELVQNQLTAEAISELAIPLLEDSSARFEMLDGYKVLRASLGEPGVTDRSAKEIFDLLTI